MDFFGPRPDVHAFSHGPLSPAPTTVPFVPVLPAHLPAVLDDPHSLVLDIRPHAAHAESRLPRALSLSVPSTLLKRPLFSLDRLAEMLSSAAARHRFAAFHDSARILVYDADSVSIPESSNIYGLLRKFRAAHFTGQLTWLRGGFQAVWREQRHLIDSSQDHDHDDADDAATASSTGTPILRTRRLPISAFGSVSTSLSSSSPVATNPFFEAVRQNSELSHGIIERIPLRLPSRVRRRIDDLPFPWLREIAKRADHAPRPRVTHPPMHLQASHPAFSQTRTSSRLYHDFDPSSSDSLSDSKASEAAPCTAAVDQGTEALAMQFYRIEVAEQRRLMGIMNHHSKESRHPPVTEFMPDRIFPFSITAGLEKGSKNRYQHIWPFEHARVKLCQTGREGKDDELDDYVNASFVQPLGTNKKYIATQGPLEATFEDFWRLAWQQNVHVIVMLTQEVESSMVKCGTYWADTPATRERTFGMLRVTLVAKIGMPGHINLMHEDSLGTASALRAEQDRRVTMIKRTFKLEHQGYPNAGSREVVQLQYLEWPDMDVPEDARGVLGLVEEVENAVQETGKKCKSPIAESREGDLVGRGEVDPLSGVAWHGKGGRRPVLLHCSAGVGRTGCFIALDAVLDAIRREVRDNMAKGKGFVFENRDGVEMEADGKMGKESMTVTMPISGQSSPTSGSGKGGLVPSVPAVLVPSTESRMDDMSMKVDGTSCTISSLPTPVSDNCANTLKKNPPTPFTIDLSSSSVVSESSFPFFPGLEKGMSRMGSESRTSHSSFSTSFYSLSGTENEGKGRRDGHIRFTTESELQGHNGSLKSLSSGVGAGPSLLSRSSSSNSHPLSRLAVSIDLSSVSDASSVSGDPSPQWSIMDFPSPRALHELPRTPVALSTFEEPIWEVVQDMRQQRMSLCQSLRQYVFVHRVVIEGALRIVDVETERQKRESMLNDVEDVMEQKSGKATDNTKLVASSSSPFSDMEPISFGSGGIVMDRSKTFPLSRLQSASQQLLPPPLSLDLSDIQRYSSSSFGSGLASDTGSSTMKRGASPTELLKEGKKGELLLSKRPSIKRKIKETKEEDLQSSAAVALESVPPSLRTLR